MSFRAGLFNLGVDGQFLIGGLGASITAVLVAGHLPPLLALAVAVAGGAISGGAYGFIPGFLKARTGAHEVITTLMLNGIAPNLAYLIVGWIALSASGGADRRGAPTHRHGDDPRRLRLRRRARDGRGRRVAAVPHARSASSSGQSASATPPPRWAGMRPGRTTVMAMSLSGGLVGMGSAFFALGPALGTSGGPSNDFGYVAIALALLAGRRPSGVE